MERRSFFKSCAAAALGVALSSPFARVLVDEDEVPGRDVTVILRKMSRGEVEALAREWMLQSGRGSCWLVGRDELVDKYKTEVESWGTGEIKIVFSEDADAVIEHTVSIERTIKDLMPF